MSRPTNPEENLYRTLFENMAEEVHYWQVVRDDEGGVKTWRLVDANPPTLKTWGKTLDQIKGKTTDEIFGPGSTDHYMPVVRKAMTEGVPHSFEDYFPNLDRHFRFTIVPLGDCFITTGAEITSVKKSHEALGKAEQRWRTMAEALPNLVWTDLPDGQCDWLSSQWRKYTGIPEHELLGLQWLEKVLHPDDRERTLACWKAACADEGDYDLEYRIRRHDGMYRWFKTRGVPVRDEQGKIVYWFGTCTDIEDNKQLEVKFKESEERQSAVIEAIPQVVWTAQTNGEVDFGSKRWYDYTGLTPEQTLGIGWTVAVHPDDLAKTLAQWEEALATGKPTEIEYRLRAGDGCYRWQLIRGVPLKNSEGQVMKWFGTITDIHDRKQAEQELQENNRRKDEFLATLAHELRNPLAPIRNGLQVMRMANGDPDAVEKARTMMERQLTQMVRLVDDLLDVSRISSGKLELKRERVPLRAVVNSAVETSRPLIEQMGHELTVKLPKQSVVVEADLTRLAQVFLNLLNNAAKYSEQGGHIWLTAERQGSDVVVSVKDKGIGIAADQLPQIFEMFSQVNRSLEKAQGGLGIGLSLVKRLVEMHGGRIEAKSDGPGQGSEFIVRLPVVLEASIPQREDARTDGDLKSSLRILVVDDNQDGADSLSMMLKMMGNDTHTAYDGEEAVVAALEFRPNVILLDIGLPKLTGYEVCRHLRQHTLGNDLVIIAQTGWGQDDDRQRTHEAGFDHHMVKPVDPQALMKLLAGLQAAKG